MALPLRYSIRNLMVRRAAALFTAMGVAMTVAVFAGILALREGFRQVYTPRGSSDLGIYLRLGSNSEGESGITREHTQILIKERPEIARDEHGMPIAAAETYLAVYMEKREGGVTNVPLRGIQPMSLELGKGHVRLIEGRWLHFGSNEVVVGKILHERMKHCSVGDTIQLNLTPFHVVGVFEDEGVQGGEIWGDADQMIQALDRPFFQRVIARMNPGTDFEALKNELEHDARTPVQVESEREYLASQTTIFGGVLGLLAGFLSVVMGVAAILGAMNTMLAAVAARTHEIGVLLAIGFRRRSIFFSFLLESALIGAVGGGIGLLLILPLDGMQTGAMNWQTFTDISFRLRITPALAGKAFGLAFLLGVFGGALPALRAATLKPVEAFRQL